MGVRLPISFRTPVDAELAADLDRLDAEPYDPWARIDVAERWTRACREPTMSMAPLLRESTRG